MDYLNVWKNAIKWDRELQQKLTKNKDKKMKEKELRIKLLENEVVLIKTEDERTRLSVKATRLGLVWCNGRSYLNTSDQSSLPYCYDLSNGTNAPLEYCEKHGYAVISVQTYLSRFPDYKPAMGDWVWVSEEDPEAKVQKLLFVTGHGCVEEGLEDAFYAGNLSADYVIGWEFITPIKDQFPKSTPESDALIMAISVFKKAEKDLESARKQIELINKN